MRGTRSALERRRDEHRGENNHHIGNKHEDDGRDETHRPLVAVTHPPRTPRDYSISSARRPAIWNAEPQTLVAWLPRRTNSSSVLRKKGVLGTEVAESVSQSASPEASPRTRRARARGATSSRPQPPFTSFQVQRRQTDPRGDRRTAVKPAEGGLRACEVYPSHHAAVPALCALCRRRARASQRVEQATKPSCARSLVRTLLPTWHGASREAEGRFRGFYDSFFISILFLLGPPPLLSFTNVTPVT